MPFGEAVHYENMDTQSLGGSMLFGAASGAAGATLVPAALPATGAVAAEEAMVLGASEATATTIGTVTSFGAEMTALDRNGGRDFAFGAVSNGLAQASRGAINYFLPNEFPSGPVPPGKITNIRYHMAETSIRPSLPGGTYHEVYSAAAQMGAQVATDSNVLPLILEW